MLVKSMLNTASSVFLLPVSPPAILLVCSIDAGEKERKKERKKKKEKKKTERERKKEKEFNNGSSNERYFTTLSRPATN